MPRTLRYDKVITDGNVIRYQCNECDAQPFKNARAANHHWNKMHNPNAVELECHFCRSTFSRKDSFTRHDCAGKSYSSKPIASQTRIIPQPIQINIPDVNQQRGEPIGCEAS